MESKPKVFWATPERDSYGNALGYSSHNRKMVEHTVPLLDIDVNAKIAIQIISADKFQYIPDRINVLFTMWEFIDVPPTYIEALEQADYVIVPSSFCRDIFTPYCKRKPIVCHEGVEPKDYWYKQRSLNGKRFRYLWVGASNPRKGYISILNVIKLADMFPDIEFYLKTTVKKTTLMEFIKNTIRNWNKIKDVEEGREKWARIFRRLPSPYNANKVFCYGKNKNVFVDTRKLPTEELNALYHSANCFLFPTLGEGWGLTLTEAMATGLPCVSSDRTGCSDYFDDSVGYVIKTEIKDLGGMPDYKLRKCRAYVPDTDDFAEKLISVYTDYKKALAKGKKASDRILNKFTWKKSGERLAQILKEIENAEIANSNNFIDPDRV